MKKINKSLLCIVALFCLISSAYAAISPPQRAIINVSSSLRKELQVNQAIIKANPRKELFAIVKRVVLPYVDINGMVSKVLGRVGNQDWVKASKSMQQSFVDQFVTLIVGTYSAALQEYNNQPVRVYPVRGFSPEQGSAEVHSVLLRDNGQKIALLYNLTKEGGDWKITDFSVEGISLVQSYQAQFQSIVQSGGLKELINTLKKHNEKTNDGR